MRESILSNPNPNPLEEMNAILRQHKNRNMNQATGKRLLIIGGTSWLAQHVHHRLKSRSTFCAEEEDSNSSSPPPPPPSSSSSSSSSPSPSTDVQVFVTYRNKGGTSPAWIDRDKCFDLDLSSSSIDEDFYKVLEATRPDTILHVAAMTSLLGKKRKSSKIIIIIQINQSTNQIYVFINTLYAVHLLIYLIYPLFDIDIYCVRVLPIYNCMHM